jgi:transposase InsO family protein
MTLPFYLETDASAYALGAVLIQKPVGSNFPHPVAFISRKLLPAEVRYPLHDKELLAIVKAFKSWRHWLLSSPFPINVFTDHANLKYFATKQNLSARHHQWAASLSEYDFRLHHRAGSLNRIADLLSRRRDHAFKEGEEQMANADTLLPKEIWVNAIAKASVGGTTLESTNIQESESSEDEVINTFETQKNDSLIVIEDENQKRLITKMRHDSILGGHFGTMKTLALIRRDFTWQGIHKYVKEYVRSCTCKRNKTLRHKPYGNLVKMPFADRPWSQISLDFIVKLPNSNGFDALLVVCDRGLTKGAHFIPTTESIDSQGVADLLMKQVFRYHGLPDSIISDRGSVFTSKVWKYVHDTLKTKIRLSTAYHPQTDGQTESTNAIWEQLVRNYTNYMQNDWTDFNYLLEMAYNNAVHSGLGCSPWFAEKGFNPRIDLLVEPSSSTSTPFTAEQHLSRLKVIQKEVKSMLEKAQDEYKKYADRRRLDSPFKVGDLVFLNAKNDLTRNWTIDCMAHMRS